MRRKPSVFISHAHADEVLAKALRTWLSTLFRKRDEFFLSCFWGDLPPGADWFDRIVGALKNCQMAILLATPNSLRRPWVHYEVGALKLTDKPMVPLCLAPTSKGSLPTPFDRAQACQFENRDDLLALIRTIAEKLDCAPDTFTLQDLREAPILTVRCSDERLPQAPDGAFPWGPRFLERALTRADRWTTIVYTCRSTFKSEERCLPDGYLEPADDAISIHSHLPADELGTFCILLRWLQTLHLRERDADACRCVLCSRHAIASTDFAVLKPTKGPTPGLLDRDLIVIGENRFSWSILRLLNAYLPWRCALEWAGAVRPGGPATRPRLYLKLADWWLQRKTGDLSANLEVEVTKGGGLIAIVPNPFNVHRRVLLVFGCHREGQYCLEEWLESKDFDSVASDVLGIQESERSWNSAIQVVVRGLPSEPARARAGSWKASAVRSQAEVGRTLWVEALSHGVHAEPFQTDSRCDHGVPIYDMSLLVVLPPEAQADIQKTIDSTVSSLDLYSEGGNCDVGLHVTLYEFLCHDQLDERTIEALDNAREVIVGGIRSGFSAPSIATMRIRQLELLPGALISYVDFVGDDGQPSEWLGNLRGSCEDYVAHLLRTHSALDKSLLNRRIVPFPLHVTLYRFNRVPNEVTQQHLRDAVNDARYSEILRLPVENLTLATARQSPYRQISRDATIVLR